MSPARSNQRQRRAWKFLEPIGVPVSAAQTAGVLGVYKDAQGRERWASVSSTAYQDRDGEIVSRAALTGAVALADATNQRGPLRFWHVPGLDLGDCDYQAVTDDGRFLIESGTFRKPAYAAAIKACGQSYQVSIGFTHPAHEPVGGVFSHIHIFERSLVPEGRASNLFTRITTKERTMPLPPEKLKALQALFGDADSSALLASVQTTDKAAQAAGIAFKEAPPDPPAVYALPDGTPAIIQDGRLVALKALTEKAPMPPQELLAAAATEQADALVDEAAAMTEVTDDMDLADLTVGQFKALLGGVMDELAGGYSAKMAEMKAQYEAMGKAFGAVQAQKDDSAAQVATLKEVATAAAKLATDLDKRLKELEGDQAGAARIAKEPQAVVPIKPTLKEGAAVEGAPALLSPAEAAYKMIFGDAPQHPIT